MPAADKTLHLVSSVTTEQTQLELALEGRHRPGQSRDRPRYAQQDAFLIQALWWPCFARLADSGCPGREGASVQRPGGSCSVHFALLISKGKSFRDALFPEGPHFEFPHPRCLSAVLEKTLESPLDCKKSQPVHSEEDQPWDFFGRNDAKAETPVLWPPHAKS